MRLTFLLMKLFCPTYLRDKSLNRQKNLKYINPVGLNFKVKFIFLKSLSVNTLNNVINTFRTEALYC